MAPSTPITRVLVVDDDDKCLTSMRRILHGHFEIVTTKDPVQALKLFVHQGPFAVVVSDYRMPFMNGVELFSRILAIDQKVQRIMLTGHAELYMAIDAINHGKISAFLTKPTPAVSIRSVISDAIRTYNLDTGNGAREKETLRTADKLQSAKQDSTEIYEPLTVKEKEVFALLAKGFSNEEISLELNITIGTVKSHLNNLFGKMDVNSRTKVVAKGISLGLVQT
ncbi:response regulator transcription factor [Sporomusa malonica]|uniref:DNA-binding response regulator, NarL/FixJ family, contains REC and HTH domains n=1 Tax=Sporomusa malonica TaxID=112901 RepID=A0A1W2DPM9_9FIRM|nr:response regulator transcription factor [Sporomusa malonica]SMC99379.1 DNA-binding response regulator, NarL/FixJ family, contains REC and HTH domains [Sporomusa malonica]